MSQRTINMTVVNASSNTITGTAYHWSGDGSNHIPSPTPALPVNLPPFGTGNDYSGEILVRSDHDDYWFWQPQGAAGPVMCQKNCKGSTVGVCLIINDNLLVVVTSDNGVATQNLPTSQTAVAQTGHT